MHNKRFDFNNIHSHIPQYNFKPFLNHRILINQKHFNYLKHLSK